MYHASGANQADGGHPAPHCRKFRCTAADAILSRHYLVLLHRQKSAARVRAQPQHSQYNKVAHRDRRDTCHEQCTPLLALSVPHLAMTPTILPFVPLQMTSRLRKYSPDMLIFSQRPVVSLNGSSSCTSHAPSVPTLAMTLTLVDWCLGSLFVCTRILSANR